MEPLYDGGIEPDKNSLFESGDQPALCHWLRIADSKKDNLNIYM